MNRSFDHLANLYSPLERLTFGHRLQAMRCATLSRLSLAQRVLILGEGDGRFAAELLRMNPRTRLTIVDKSARMLEVAAQRTRFARERVRYMTADVVSVDLQSDYDAVVTNFFLDCFGPVELERVMTQLDAALRPAGVWHYADFAIPKAGWEHVTGRLLVSSLYWAFRSLTDIRASHLADPAPFWRTHHYCTESRVDDMRGLLTARLLRKPSGDPLLDRGQLTDPAKT